MIFRLLVMIIQLMSAAFVIYLILRFMSKKQAEFKRQEVLDEHYEKLKDEQLKRELKRRKQDGEK